MFCVQEHDDPLSDPFADKDPFRDPLITIDSSDDEPTPKRSRVSLDSACINMKVYDIQAFKNTSLSIVPSNQNLDKNIDAKWTNRSESLTNNKKSPYTSLTVTPVANNGTIDSKMFQTTFSDFINNPVKKLANPLELAAVRHTTCFGNLAKNLPKFTAAKSSIPLKSHALNTCTDKGDVVRYKKNGEVAKKRGPPKGYKRKPKENLSQSLPIMSSVKNGILTSMLASKAVTSNDSKMTQMVLPKLPPALMITPKVQVPKGVELVELDLDPADWFPDEPYRMTYSKKKHPKWKDFPYKCEYCHKGYRVASTLLAHSAERHGSVPKSLAIPCPCCQHVSVRRKQHRKHLEEHSVKRGKLFCLYCLPCPDPSEPYVKESEKYSYKIHPQYWYASEESLRLHKKRKHPYAAMFNYHWFCTWGETISTSTS